MKYIYIYATIELKSDALGMATDGFELDFLFL